MSVGTLETQEHAISRFSASFSVVVLFFWLIQTEKAIKPRTGTPPTSLHTAHTVRRPMAPLHTFRKVIQYVEQLKDE